MFIIRRICVICGSESGYRDDERIEGCLIYPSILKKSFNPDSLLAILKS
jgi:hypothetical protein